MNDLAARERLGRKFTCAPFIPHGRGLINNCDSYCVDNLNIPPILFFVSNITFSGERIFMRNIYLHYTDISDTGVQMFLRTNDKNN